MWDDVRKLGIWGFGREGRATLGFVTREHPDVAVTVLTDRPLDDAPAVAALSGEAANDAIAAGRFDLVVKTPGISLRRAEIAAGRRAGSRFTSATNLWFDRHGTANTVAITGTKGKSTTATLLVAILRAAGRDVALLGNTGTPAIGAPPGRDATIFELSSYQIADLAFAPPIAVLTNLFPEHVPWHGDIETYYAEKLRLATIDPTTIVVANARDAELRGRLAGRANVVWFNAAEGFAECDGALTFAGAPVAIDGRTPPGRHNLSNLAAAATVARLLGIAVTARIALGDFVPLAHRLQEAHVGGGILAVDDSIATIPEATIAALAHYDGRPIRLFVGGSDRGQRHDELCRAVARASVRAVYLLPTTGAQIAPLLRAEAPGLTVAEYADLETAVGQAMRDAEPGDVLLLSPAAASFVQFRDFEERGDTFIALCTALAAAAQP